MTYYSLKNADSATKGLIQLAGDIGGSADSPTVPALSTKADAAAVYTKGEVDGALAAKADTATLSSYVASSEKGAVNGVATLDSNGKLVSSQMDVTFPVTSVSGKTGDVTLAKSDVGLANVDNTSDANKPISSATQTALNDKANTVHAHAIADVTSLQTTLDAKADAAATTAALAGKAATSHTHAVADVTGLQTAIDGKAAASHTHTASQISDSTAVGRSVLTAADTAAAQSALAIANTVQVVDSFAEVTAPVYGTLYVVRA